VLSFAAGVAVFVVLVWALRVVTPAEAATARGLAARVLRRLARAGRGRKAGAQTA
jgi:hypothetical protein